MAWNLERHRFARGHVRGTLARHRETDHPGARPVCGLCTERGGPEHAGGSCDHHHARLPFVRIARPRWQEAPHVSVVDEPDVSTAGVEPDVCDLDLSRKHRAVSLEQPGFECREGDGEVRSQRLAGDLARVAVDPRRYVDRKNANSGGNRRSLVRTPESRAVCGIDHQIEPGVAHEPFGGFGRLDDFHPRSAARATFAAATLPSAPLLPLPATTTTRLP